MRDDPIKAIEDLHRLKGDGVITDAEFEEAKRNILFGQRSATRQTVDITDPEMRDHIGWIILPLQRYAQFEGRSVRKEFWMFQLLYVALFLFTAIIVGAGTDEYGEGTGLAKLTVGLFAIALLGLFVPLIAVQVRRFHDQDKSGWFALLNLIPYVGFLIVLGFMLIEGTRGSNRFGSDPRQG